MEGLAWEGGSVNQKALLSFHGGTKKRKTFASYMSSTEDFDGHRRELTYATSGIRDQPYH